MRFRLEFELDNAVFDYDSFQFRRSTEAVREVLSSIQEDMNSLTPWITVKDQGRIRDPNGNPIGHWEVVPPAAEEDESLVDELSDDGLSDIEADRMTLRDAGMGTDEDYGCYGWDREQW